MINFLRFIFDKKFSKILKYQEIFQIFLKQDCFFRNTGYNILFILQKKNNLKIIFEKRIGEIYSICTWDQRNSCIESWLKIIISQLTIRNFRIIAFLKNHFRKLCKIHHFFKFISFWCFFFQMDVRYWFSDKIWFWNLFFQ